MQRYIISSKTQKIIAEMTPTTPIENPEAHLIELTQRDLMLKELLPYDFDYAKKSGLIDMFYYNPETGEDGLTHTLGGNLIVGTEGAKLVEGFHHAPSAEIM